MFAYPRAILIRVFARWQKAVEYSWQEICIGRQPGSYGLVF